MTSYIRDRNRILNADGSVVKEHKSINAAKRHSRELQSKGNKVSAAKRPVALHTQVEAAA